MKITGHKTASMFERYSIVDAADVRQALRSMRSYRNEREQQVVPIAK